MDQLPVELLLSILQLSIRDAWEDKNSLLPLRLTCKAFDNALAPYLMNRIKLDHTSFLCDSKLNIDALKRAGSLCNSVYLDMLVVHDEDQIQSLKEIFNTYAPRHQEMYLLMDRLEKYCIRDSIEGENHFSRVTQDVIAALPNLTRFKIVLPYQTGETVRRPAIKVLSSTLALLAKRNEEHQRLETLVLDYVSDIVINNIFRNHIDVQNACRVFSELDTLTITITKREVRSSSFGKNLWFLIEKAAHLKSLCLVGWAGEKWINRSHIFTVELETWERRCFPYPLDSTREIKTLRTLELRKLRMHPDELLRLIEDCSSTLQELYLVMVGLKIDEEEQGENVPLWVGYPEDGDSTSAIRIARRLRQMRNLKLSVLRATFLSYSDCGLAVWDTPPESAHPDLDRVDTTGGNKSLEQRFVEAVMHPDIKVAVPQPAAEQQETASPTSSGKQKVEIRRTKKEEDMINCLDTVLAPLGNLSVQPWAVAQTELEDSIAGMIAVSKPAPPPLRLIDYDANAFQAEYKTLPDYKSSIDGLFDDHLELGHRELRKMIRIMDRGMEIIDRDSARPNGLDVENERVLADDGANATSNGAGREEEDGNVDPEDIEIEYSENDLDSDWEIDEEDI